MPESTAIIGIDIGGTFTDFVLVQAGNIRIHKRLTTPDDPSRGLLEGLAALGVPASADVVHGSTIATNALLERRGAPTALITTRGFADVLDIGRQNRPDLYALSPQPPAPLVPAAHRFELDERVTSEGDVRLPIETAQLRALVSELEVQDIESVAVCLLFSFLRPAHEQMVRDALGNRFFVSLSSEILPEYREYERMSTTVMNACVAPLMARYLSRVEKGLGGRRLRVMQSNGGVITAETARHEAARTALSGPAGGAVGAFHAARMAGHDHIVSFDMGGTSTDVALFPGDIVYTRDANIGGLPLRLPVVDIHTVGAGGGSLAWVDAGGALRVGPESAGADPGPACYGRGERPTVSDANLVLGRLHPAHFLGGAMPLYPERSEAVLAGLAADGHLTSVTAAAWGVVRVANAAMERAIRRISVERGYDPRQFTLVPFGGAGPLHACALAEALLMPRMLIPTTPGVLSALGMTIADLVKDYTQTVMQPVDVLEPGALDTIFAPLEQLAAEDLNREGVSAERIRLQRVLDMRYRGQSHEIAVAAPGDHRWVEAFHALHAQRYGHRHDAEPVEVVNAHLQAVGETPKPVFEPVAEGTADASHAVVGRSPVWYSPDASATAVCYDRTRLLANNRIHGPALVFQLDTTTVIAPEWVAQVDRWGNLVLTR